VPETARVERGSERVGHLSPGLSGLRAGLAWARQERKRERRKGAACFCWAEPSE
jgi:hypothetical protein